MDISFSHTKLLFLLVLTTTICSSEEQESSQVQTLLKIQDLFNHLAALGSWNYSTDFCRTEPTPSVIVVCYEESITQLHIIGEKNAPPLPRNFSIDSFVTALANLSTLKVLTLVSLGIRGQLPSNISHLTSLEILNISSNFFHGPIPQEVSSLRNLQTLVLDNNMFKGRIPNGLTSLSLLAVLSVKRNQLNGLLPDSLGNLENLRVLDLSHNKFTGEVPDISSLQNLQVLQLEDNLLGAQFPQISGKGLVTLVLRKNKFNSGIPDNVLSFKQLQRLDISFNRFVGPFKRSLFSLPSITYLNIKENKFTGMLSEDMACNALLEVVDLSGNLLSGSLPSCLISDPKKRVVVYSGNCLASADKSQHPMSFCRNEALAVGISPRQRKPKEASSLVLALSISGAILGGIVLVALVLLVVRRVRVMKFVKSPSARLMQENASIGYTSKLLSDARYITQTMKLGALGIPAYRTFSVEEVGYATNNFDTSNLMEEGSYSQMYKGKLEDGSLIAIRCLKMKKSHSTQSLTHYLEFISKLRHQHLASTLGHCFEYYLDDSSVSRIFLVFEYVANGTLRDWITERSDRDTLTSSQRIAAAIGVAKGIQFLHTGIVPGVFRNNLRIIDILLDQNLVAKISSYKLPLLAENMGKVGLQIPSGGLKEVDTTRIVYQEKSDIYDLGVILLEIITGKHLNNQKEVDACKHQLNETTTADNAARKSVADPVTKNTYSDESLKTLIEICSRCLLEDPAGRPSIEDVLWNLQFAAQVQDSAQSIEGSPASAFQSPRFKIVVK